ncbi:YT521-B-like domain-containing protein [Hyaloraphidium curvatum]|nr:YT521-B-like domain-containing protein [Hyaloraphidium curvatum]
MQNRYFVMRGLTLLDLELSVRNGVWATQKRNTLTLNQAFHMCENVYLIFSVLGSNEWFGLARMEAPIPVIRVQSIATRLDGTADPFAGEFFRVQWICSAAHLPFHETDHIINPFNLGSVVKRSVDGTEVHPGWAETLIAAIHAASTKNEVARIATQSRNPSWQRPVSPTDDWFQSTSTPRSARPPSESSFGAIGAEVKHKSSPQIELQPGPKTMHDMLPPLPKSTSGEVTRTVSFPFLTIATDGTIEDPSSIAESSGSTAAGSSGIDHLTHGLWDLGLGARSPSPSARPGSPFSPFAFTY